MTHSNRSVPVAAYVSAMAATRDLEAPYGAIVLTMMTGLLQVHEIQEPTTTFDGANLQVVSVDRIRRPRNRRVCAPRTLAAVLGRPGVVSSRLGCMATSLPGLPARLRTVLLDHEQTPGLASPENIHATALHGLLAAAADGTQRMAVLRYAGLIPVPQGETSVPGLADPGLVAVAGLVDRLVRRAGFDLKSESVQVA